jgi:hypothetical protein
MQFPLQIRTPRLAGDWPAAQWIENARRHAERMGVALTKVRARPATESGAAFRAGRLVHTMRTLRARIDADWVLGSLAWLALVYSVMHFTGMP